MQLEQHGHEPELTFLRSSWADRDVPLEDELEALEKKQITNPAERMRVMQGITERVNSLRTEPFAVDCINAILEKKYKGIGNGFAALENKLETIFYQLPQDAMIEEEVARALEPLLTYVQRYYFSHKEQFDTAYSLHGKQVSEIDSLDFVQFFSKPEGVTSPLKYIRARELGFRQQKEKGVYASNLRQKFYGNSRLDSEYAVDLVEVIYGKEVGKIKIEEIRLIQVASSEGSAVRKQDKVSQVHRALLDLMLDSFENFEKWYYPELRFANLDQERDYFTRQFMELSQVSDSESPEQFSDRFGKYVNDALNEFASSESLVTAEGKSYVMAKVVGDFLIVSAGNKNLENLITQSVIEKLVRLLKEKKEKECSMLAGSLLEVCNNLVGQSAYGPETQSAISHFAENISQRFAKQLEVQKHPHPLEIPVIKSILTVAHKPFKSEILLDRQSGQKKYLVQKA